VGSGYGLTLGTSLGCNCDHLRRRALASETIGLTMVDMVRIVLAVGHLGLETASRRSACRQTLQRRLDLPRDSLEFGVGHDARRTSVFPRSARPVTCAGVAFGNHNRERVGGVRAPRGRGGRPWPISASTFLRPAKIGVRLWPSGHVHRGDVPHASIAASRPRRIVSPNRSSL